jgi:CRP/FNR family transcriptional regulator
VPIFSSLQKEELIKLSSLIEHLSFRKGEILFEEGSHPASLYILNAGGVKAYRYTPEGREQIFHVFSEGDFFGEQFLLGNRRAAYSVEALEPVKICTLSKENFQQVLLKFPEIAIRIIEEIEERLSRLEDVMQGMGVRSLDSRISSLLLAFSDQYGSDTSEGSLIRLPLSREGIANYLGIARETVSRKLGQLENDQIIRSVGKRNILILDRTALETSAGKQEEYKKP